uniref:Ribosome biogenesis protein BOP1 homolog n=1 Tax=Albugo laibachii Nc14 TaxID=890382 RepID=F0WFD5_9STRA|nr:conserved hypothetical protein [Albugo laibachii Nc14]|eukprot:CCA19917.1 conserved hypothetical protein [Albugo laibachii Nc14]
MPTKKQPKRKVIPHETMKTTEQTKPLSVASTGHSKTTTTRMSVQTGIEMTGASNHNDASNMENEEDPSDLEDTIDSETDDTDEDNEFEDQGSSSEEESDCQTDEKSDELLEENCELMGNREKQVELMRANGSLEKASRLHIDDLSSDDEETRNTIGNVPLRWYDEYEHIGYSVDGQKLIKSKNADNIDNVLSTHDDPEYNRTVYDAYNDRKIVLSEREIEIIRRIQAGAFAHPEFDAYPELLDIYSSDKMIHSMANDQEPKSRFIPSKWERMKILKIAKGIKEGRITVNAPAINKLAEFYQLWHDDEATDNTKGLVHVKAPKMPLPGHAESYNPPEEYLFTKEERRAWEEMDPEDRETDFIPQKFKSFREISGYSHFARERFERCLDLYLCPRTIKRKLNIDPESLVPQLPNPRDLRPFPNTRALTYKGHTGRIRSLTLDPCGQFLATGSDDFTVRIWEISTGRCLYTYNVGAIVYKVLWNPNPDHQLLAVAAARKILLIATGLGSTDQTDITNALVGDAEVSAVMDVAETNTNKFVIKDTDDVDVATDAGDTKSLVSWRYYKQKATDRKHKSKACAETDVRIIIHHTSDVKDIAWHYKGDYLASVTPTAGAAAVLIHQISKKKTQNPFRKNLGTVQSVLFHPTKPFLFHATQRHVRVYNLIKQTLVKKLSSGVKWISSLDVHPSGDHLIIGSYDRRLCWFDLDLSSTPFKTLKYHEKAIRAVSYHSKHPLMASCSDDGTVHIFHAMVYSDLIKNPLIVPLKILRGHQICGDLGVMAVAFHPALPWLVTGGADGTVRLFQNIH